MFIRRPAFLKLYTVKKLLTFLLFIPVIGIAQIPDPLPGTYVNDSYGFLHAADVQQLNKNIRALEDSFGVQLAIVLVPAIPEKYSIEDYAREIGRKWHVGHAKNGLVYVAAIDEHKQRLEVANHIEGIIPDIVAKGLLQKIGVYYRAKKYGEGLLGFVSDLQVRLASSKEELRALANGQKIKKAETDKGTLAFIVLMIAGAAFIGVMGYVYYKRRQEEKERERQEQELRAAAEKQRIKDLQKSVVNPLGSHLETQQSKGRTERQPSYTRNNEYPIVPVIPDSGIDYSRRNDDNYNSGGGNSGESSGSSSSSNSDSGSSSSGYGDWGSGSSDSGSSSYDSGSSSSGFDGGGSSDSW